MKLILKHLPLWNVTVGDRADEVGIRVEHHDMEVFHGTNRLEATPVLEPDNLIIGHMGSKRLCHEVINLLPRLVDEISRNGVLLEEELGPDNQVDNATVNSVGPVVDEYFDVIFELEGPATGPYGSLPLETLVEDEIGDAAVGFDKIERVGLVATQIRWHSLEVVEFVCLGDLADLIPGEDVVVAVRSGKDTEVLCGNVEEEIGTIDQSIRSGDVDLPVRQGNLVAHGGEFVCDMYRNSLGRGRGAVEALSGRGQMWSNGKHVRSQRVRETATEYDAVRGSTKGHKGQTKRLPGL